VHSIRCVSRADNLPFELADAMRSEEELQREDAQFATVTQDTRLENRWIDLRTPVNQAIFKIQSAVCQVTCPALSTALHPLSLTFYSRIPDVIAQHVTDAFLASYRANSDEIRGVKCRASSKPAGLSCVDHEKMCMSMHYVDSPPWIKIYCALQLFREALLSEGFQEIHTPKLIAGASEGGAAVFKLDYVGQPGCLAQSPQFYKQMAVCSDFSRVFEIGPVFR